MLAVSIPNSATFSALVDTATKCRATARVVAAERGRAATCRAEVAFVIVSSVVNVFDETMNNVSSASKPCERVDEIGAVDVRHEPELQSRGRCRRASAS